MAAEVKFCGITRADDAAEAARLGASYVGAIFAGGPRAVDPAVAAENFAGLAGGVRRVGVFGRSDAAEIARIAGAARLDIVQLHGDPVVEDVHAVRDQVEAAVWAVVRIDAATLPPTVDGLARSADALLLDARVAGALGGTGTRLDWEALSEPVARLRERVPVTIILAGGLAPENVGRAIEALHPDAVDVSSGVERAPGIKDHERMRAFMDAVQRAGANR